MVVFVNYFSVELQQRGQFCSMEAKKCSGIFVGNDPERERIYSDTLAHIQRHTVTYYIILPTQRQSQTYIMIYL